MCACWGVCTGAWKGADVVEPTWDMDEDPAAAEGRAGVASKECMALAGALGGLANVGMANVGVLFSACSLCRCNQTREPVVISALNRGSPPKHRDHLLCAAFMKPFVHYSIWMLFDDRMIDLH